MFYVYFARGYANEEMVAECRTEAAARLRADEEYANGSRDIEVYDRHGAMIYMPSDEFLVDEF